MWSVARLGGCQLRSGSLSGPCWDCRLTPSTQPINAVAQNTRWWLICVEASFFLNPGKEIGLWSERSSSFQSFNFYHPDFYGALRCHTATSPYTIAVCGGFSTANTIKTTQISLLTCKSLDFRHCNHLLLWLQLILFVAETHFIDFCSFIWMEAFSLLFCNYLNSDLIVQNARARLWYSHGSDSGKHLTPPEK